MSAKGEGACFLSQSNFRIYKFLRVFISSELLGDF
jgi:hypothetical protein